MELQSEIQVLEGARVAIYHTEKDGNLQQQMAAYGFTQKQRQHGKNLLAKALLLQAMRIIQEDEWGSSVQQIRADVQATQTMFREHVHTVRKAFRHDPVVLQRLQIQRNARKRTTWLQQAFHFYTLLEEHTAQLEPFGIHWSVIQQAKASVKALLALKEERTRIKGRVEARAGKNNQITEAKIFKALEGWVMEFQHIARLAFKDNPQMLKIFGISQAQDFQS